jgi:hypothetical protein
VSSSIADGTSVDKLKIKASTETEVKELDDIVMDMNVKKIKGKRTKGKQHKLRIDLTEAGNGKVENVQCVFEEGKL